MWVTYRPVTLIRGTCPRDISVDQLLVSEDSLFAPKKIEKSYEGQAGHCAERCILADFQCSFCDFVHKIMASENKKVEVPSTMPEVWGDGVFGRVSIVYRVCACGLI
ncbi:hypothetical protein AAMO2058_000907800 [Amorphochlora amoebiformis]